MIPTIEQIVEGLLDGSYTKQQCVSWLHQHAEGAANELRDAFAMSALQGLLAAPTNANDNVMAALSYNLADAMLTERGKKFYGNEKESK